MGRDREADEVAATIADARHGQTSRPADGTPVSVVDVAASDDASAAIAELEQRVNLDAGPQRLHEALAAMSGLVSPMRATPSAIADLFDKYADRFEHHLRDKLAYAGPEQLHLSWEHAIAPMFELAERSLRSGGLLAASFEAGDAERYTRDHRTRRFTHSRQYLEKLGKIFGFTQRSMERMTLRYEMHTPVDAWIAVFEK